MKSGREHLHLAQPNKTRLVRTISLALPKRVRQGSLAFPVPALSGEPIFDDKGTVDTR